MAATQPLFRNRFVPFSNRTIKPLCRFRRHRRDSGMAIACAGVALAKEALRRSSLPRSSSRRRSSTKWQAWRRLSSAGTSSSGRATRASAPTSAFLCARYSFRWLSSFVEAFRRASTSRRRAPAGTRNRLPPRGARSPARESRRAERSAAPRSSTSGSGPPGEVPLTN